MPPAIFAKSHINIHWILCQIYWKARALTRFGCCWTCFALLALEFGVDLRVGVHIDAVLGQFGNWRTCFALLALGFGVDVWVGVHVNKHCVTV